MKPQQHYTKKVGGHTTKNKILPLSPQQKKNKPPLATAVPHPRVHLQNPFFFFGLNFFFSFFFFIFESKTAHNDTHTHNFKKKPESREPIHCTMHGYWQIQQRPAIYFFFWEGGGEVAK